MKIQVHNSCSEFKSYRAERVRSIFNCQSGANFRIEADIPADEDGWSIGVIVGPSGSGKSSIGKQLWTNVQIENMDDGWRNDAPIVDCITPDDEFNNVTSALAAVGLGDVPSCRPYHVLSNGEKFRAGLARIIAEKKDRVIIDEFTSVIDRQIAKIGSLAFAKSWRRGGGKAVILSCHYDILDWLQPDWVFDTQTRSLQRGWERPRPAIEIEVRQVGHEYWHLFEPHHYLELETLKGLGARYYVGFYESSPICHVCVSPKLEIGGMRCSRLVVMPEWQGAGIGLKFLNAVAKMQIDPAVNKFADRVKAVYINTSHAGLARSLFRSGWERLKRNLHQFGQRKIYKPKNKDQIVCRYDQKPLCSDRDVGRAIQGFRLPRARLANFV